jgi:hypothetical protein
VVTVKLGELAGHSELSIIEALIPSRSVLLSSAISARHPVEITYWKVQY